MLRLATDEDFNNRILRGLLRRKSDLDIVRVQDAGLIGKGDGEVLEWTAREDRILLTHDVTTMKQYVDERIAAGLSMPGVFEVSQQVPIARAIEDYFFLLNAAWKMSGRVRSDSFHSARRLTT
jgi:hypothetical protein